MSSIDKKRELHVKVTDYMSSGYEITTKFNAKYNSEIDRSRKDQATIRSAKVAAQRAHTNLFGILRCQPWSFFVTLTFEGDLTDDQCRRKFQRWREEVRQSYPDMYYVAVPEYQSGGKLHYHLVVGGVTLHDLKCVDSGRVLHHGCAWLRDDFVCRGFEYNEKTGEGMTIYNIEGWNGGFSTLTEVRYPDAVTRYIGKYITKNNLDPRFYNKRRFHCSQNILRPFSVGMVFDEDSQDTVDQMLSHFGSRLSYQDRARQFSKFDPSLSKEERIKAFLYGELPNV